MAAIKIVLFFPKIYGLLLAVRYQTLLPRYSMAASSPSFKECVFGRDGYKCQVRSFASQRALSLPLLFWLTRRAVEQYCSVKVHDMAFFIKHQATRHLAGDLLATLDHVLPRSRDGHSTFANCVTACRLCNKRKKNKTPAEVRPLCRVFADGC